MRLCPFAILGILVIGVFFSAPGQTKPEPPRRPSPVPPVRKDTLTKKPDVALPKIELPEYDITGTLVPGVANSNKVAGEADGALDPLGRKNLRSREPQWLDQGMWKLGAEPAAVPGARAGRAYAGYGSFQSPWMDLSVNLGNPDFDLAIRGGYGSSAGHVERADFRRGFASLGILRGMDDSAGVLSHSTLRAAFGYGARTYTPYGAKVLVGDRTLHQFSSGVSLGGVTWGKTILEGGIAVSGASLVDPVTTQQTRFGMHFRGTREVGALSFEGGMELALSGFSAPTETRNPVYLRTSILGQGEVVENVVLRGGFAGYLERGTTGDSRGYLYPLASVSWYPSTPLEIFVRFEPSVTERTLGDLAGSAPYLARPAYVQHEVAGTDLAAGMALGVRRSLRVRLVTRYQRVNNYFSPVDTARVGLWDAWYEGVSTIVSAEGDLTWQMTEADLFTAKMRTLLSKNSVTEEKIPYLPALRIDGSYAHWFSFGLLIAGDVKMIGARSADLQASRTLDPFVLLDVSAEYNFLPGWRVLGQIANLLGLRHEWWEGYVALPRTGSLGISYSW
jgi:hypothetical protein